MASASSPSSSRWGTARSAVHVARGHAPGGRDDECARAAGSGCTPPGSQHGEDPGHGTRPMRQGVGLHQGGQGLLLLAQAHVHDQHAEDLLLLPDGSGRRLGGAAGGRSAMGLKMVQGAAGGCPRPPDPAPAPGRPGRRLAGTGVRKWQDGALEAPGDAHALRPTSLRPAGEHHQPRPCSGCARSARRPCGRPVRSTMVLQLARGRCASWRWFAPDLMASQMRSASRSAFLSGPASRKLLGVG